MAIPRPRNSSRPGTRRRPASERGEQAGGQQRAGDQDELPVAHRTRAYDVLRREPFSSALPSRAMQSWAEHAERRLAEAGFRRGGARAAVIALLDRQACALSAYEIEDELRADGRGVARASVYRVLDELVGLGLVTPRRGRPGLDPLRGRPPRRRPPSPHGLRPLRRGAALRRRRARARRRPPRRPRRLRRRRARDRAPRRVRRLPGVGVTREQVQAWLDAYVDAWRTCEASTIGALFSADATYAYHPDDEPERGREAIVASWLSEPRRGVARGRRATRRSSSTAIAPCAGETVYTDGRRFSNLVSCASTRRGLQRVRRVVIENPAGACAPPRRLRRCALRTACADGKGVPRVAGPRAGVLRVTRVTPAGASSMRSRRMRQRQLLRFRRARSRATGSASRAEGAGPPPLTRSPRDASAPRRPSHADAGASGAHARIVVPLPARLCTRERAADRVEAVLQAAQARAARHARAADAVVGDLGDQRAVLDLDRDRGLRSPARTSPRWSAPRRW